MRKEYRIKKSEDIESLIKLKNVKAEEHFVIYYKENHELDHFHYALSVPKKFGIAVKRNEIKRRVRSIVRLNPIKKDIEFFIVIKDTARTLSFEEIKLEINNLLKKSNILEEINEN